MSSSILCPQRAIPNPIRRILRQEVNFGCAICGNPLLEMHHIVPWSQTHQNNPSDMIALCPTDHTKADKGVYPDDYLREYKKSPHNRIITNEKEVFFIPTEDLILSLGGIEIINTPRVLVIDNFDIISVTKEERYPQFEINFFDKFNNWIAIIQQNQWYVDTRFVWDIIYRPKHLALKCRPKDISLDIEIVDDVVSIQGDLFLNSLKLKITKNKLLFGGNSIQGRRIENCIVALEISSGKPFLPRPPSF